MSNTRRIWKYELKVTDYQKVAMPGAARVLSAQCQGGALCVWALVDTAEKIRDREFWIVGTGMPLPDLSWGLMKHVDTVQQNQFVWHVFTKPTD